ncbi:Rho termination factor N-terminal domain-containing protein, partial [Streptomyces pathocidini]|uniref:Rho termination factor N-terminal domain-containing protein n=1 Tax=Streptomyces pathocidini TaxID=1650571 RepID=UPI0033D1DF24
MSDTTDLMGVTADNTVGAASAPATDAPAAPKRRRSGTGLEGMVLAELQQVASGLGIKGTARMRKSQLIEVIKEKQAGGSAPVKGGEAEAEAKPKRRTTSKARTGESAESAAPAAEKAVAQQQIEIPGQPSDEQPAGERRRRRATSAAGSPEAAEAATDTKVETRTETRTDARAETAVETAEGRGKGGDRQDRGQGGQKGERGDRRERPVDHDRGGHDGHGEPNPSVRALVGGAHRPAD